MARYVFTQYLFGGGAFPAPLMDARVDSVLRGLGLTPEPARVEATRRVPFPVERPAEGGAPGAIEYVVTVPSGFWPRCTDPCQQTFPNDIEASEIDTISKVTKVFTGDIPSKPWTGANCAASGLPASQCTSSTSADNSLRNALSRAMAGSSGDLVTRYGFYAVSETGASPLTEVSSSGGGMWIFLALAAGALWVKSQGAGAAMAGFGRVPPRLKATRLRKRATRLRHAGRYMEANRLERRANQITRSSSR